MHLSDSEGDKKGSTSPKTSNSYKTREQNNWTFSGEHDFHFPKHPGVQSENKGLDSCLLPLRW